MSKTISTRQAVGLVDPSGNEDDHQVLIHWAWLSNPYDKEKRLYGGEDDGWALEDISLVDAVVRKVLGNESNAEIEQTKAADFVQWMTRQVALSEKVGAMTNAELLWWTLKSLNINALDGNVIEAVWNEIEDRLYPGYDGDHIQLTDTGWETPEGPVNYVTPEVGLTIKMSRQQIYDRQVERDNRIEYLEKEVEKYKTQWEEDFKVRTALLAERDAAVAKMDEWMKKEAPPGAIPPVSREQNLHEGRGGK